MSIARPDQSTINDCIDIICNGFEIEYQALFRVPVARLKPFVRLSIEKGDSWALVEDGVVKGVLILDHHKHKGAGLNELFKVLFTTIPIWSAIFAARYLLAPRVSIKDCVHIDQIAVGKNFRGQGIGTKLLEFTEQRTKELGFCKINLRVRANNPAFNLYRRLGFETFRAVSSLIFRSASGYRTVYFMVKTICS